MYTNLDKMKKKRYWIWLCNCLWNSLWLSSRQPFQEKKMKKCLLIFYEIAETLIPNVDEKMNVQVALTLGLDAERENEISNAIKKICKRNHD